MNYLSVSGETRTQKIIEKSKFITTSAHVEGEEQAKDFIVRVSKEFVDAAHNCYAFICDAAGNFLRFSDDGEPQGTAGMPMLGVLKNKKLVQTAVVVTRYFGGVKLGAGGLVRAYASSCAEVLDVAEICLWQSAAKFAVTVDYPQADAALRFFAARGLTVADAEYAAEVRYTLSMPATERETFVRALTDALNGRVKIEKTGEAFEPFPLGE